MGKIEKTVFISYRRKDISWALLVYKYLAAKGYDVFFDYTSIPSGDFEQIILSNIKARAHFLVILTPSALDRCDELGDWLRREIESALSERRNIVPLFFDGFSFGTPSVSKNLTGDLGRIKRYNGLDVPPGYFDAAMERLCNQYLNVTLDAVLHPISDEVQEVVKEQQIAADREISRREKAKEKERKEKEELDQKDPDVKTQMDIVDEVHARISVEQKAETERVNQERRDATEKARKEREGREQNLKRFGIGGLILMGLIGLIFGGNYIFSNFPASTEPTPTEQIVVPTNTRFFTNTPEPPQSTPTPSNTFTLESPTDIPKPLTPTPTFKSIVPQISYGQTTESEFIPKKSCCNVRVFGFAGNEGDKVSIYMFGESQIIATIQLQNQSMEVLTQSEFLGTMNNAAIENFQLPYTGIYYLAEIVTGNDGFSYIQLLKH